MEYAALGSAPRGFKADRDAASGQQGFVAADRAGRQAEEMDFGVAMYEIIPVDPFDLVLFGATGDLSKREILPGLYRRFKVAQMPPDSRVIGSARTAMSRDGFRKLAAEAIEAAIEADAIDHNSMGGFLDCLEYVAVDGERGGWEELARTIRDDVIAAYYLSVAPKVFPVLVRNLKDSGLARKGARIVVEKPFGNDLESARALNSVLSDAFSEAQIYRIDHYLGKETVQNLMALRFGNILFEPLWNSRFVDHVQITVAEEVGIEGRGGYYDDSGAMRDMVQNHLMQLLCLTAMEPPSTFSADAVRDEKLKVIRALEPVDPECLVRGQYGGGPGVRSYLGDAGIDDSKTESYVAFRCGIANWRWAGTPFYLRTGKRLRKRLSEVAIVFRSLPHSIFSDHESIDGNVLAIRLQPNEGITMRLTIKEPGPGGMRLTNVPLDMSFADAPLLEMKELTNAYERLIMDVIRGNQTLFMRNDEVEAAWKWADPVIGGWEASGSRPLIYDPGTDGPASAAKLFPKGGAGWRPIEH